MGQEVLFLTFSNSWSAIKGTNLPNDYFSGNPQGNLFCELNTISPRMDFLSGVQYQQKGRHNYRSKIKALGDQTQPIGEGLNFMLLISPFLWLQKQWVIRNTKIPWNMEFHPWRTSVHLRFCSVEDGFHLIENHKRALLPNDIRLPQSLGIDINTGNAYYFKYIFMAHGDKNVYNNDYYPNAEWQNKSYWLAFRMAVFE